MFSRIKARFNDMSTIKSLCEAAEAYALQDQQREPGAEHFLLAALDLPDGTARLTFERIRADPEALKPAIARQYGDALAAIGLDVGAAASAGYAPLAARPGPFNASASGQEIMQQLAAERKAHGPLLGAHVVATIASMQHGVAARALRAMGVDAGMLKAAAEEIAKGS
ncbi:ATP-dependent Clp protease ATP-binding subunit ClpA [Aminobacter lissarensis]|uniref:ATP-dependent Clp protease ATP-binding subunit ClpA n=1 Tax=Aminobacter carboxidus TaxID=376165 RepID=A0A8E1WFC5_9HYPH|nr:Clp protease N-terminal domain-containing protein [Aminobacter lissarensis]MBB6467820.1 ATP-dependent Clp protease ATP-binding subunit ClpA [Aminobacter lissarensis]